MDNNANNVIEVHRTIIRGPIGPHRDIMALTARLKGRHVSTVDDNTHKLDERRPGSVISITGFWPAIAYLDERYPDPGLIGRDPIESAAIRSLVEELLHGDAEASILSMLERSANDCYLLSNRPTLLDVTAAVVARYTGLSAPDATAFWDGLYDRLHVVGSRHAEARTL